MTTVASRKAVLPVVPLAGWRWALTTERKLKYAVLLIVLSTTAYICLTVGKHIEELLANKTAASTALYMDSFVEPLVQDLVTRATLSPESRSALEGLFAPASIGKPVVSFRIWLTDTIVFSSRSELIGKKFRSTPARSSAFEGHVVARFGLDGDDDEDERALGVPVLKLYAPIRQTGTRNIIALAETTELATNLTQEIRMAQYASYAGIIGAAGGLVLLLFKLVNSLPTRIGKLTEQQAEHVQFRNRVYQAQGRVLEMRERHLRKIGEQLKHGPLRLIALAQLSLGALRENPDRAHAEIESLKETLNDFTKQVRGLSAEVAPLQLEEMSLSEVISMSVCLRDRTSVTADLQNLPDSVPYLVKSCIYQILEQAIRLVLLHTAKASVHVCAGSASEELTVTLNCEADLSKPILWVVKEIESKTETLKHLVEALGGALTVHSQGDHALIVAANFWMCDWNS